MKSNKNIPFLQKCLLLLFLVIPQLLSAKETVQGDVNSDGEINIADVNVIIDSILGNLDFASADVNGDGEINIADVNAVINLIIYGSPSDNWTEDPGLYMSIIGFNQQLYTKDFSLLNLDTKSTFDSFVDALTINYGTILYYAEDKALTMLDSIPHPKNLKNVLLVTFTDGLDQGSLMITDKGYTSNSEYVEDLASCVRSKKIHGLPIQAYTIGLKGNDVVDDEMFISNLNALATSDDNVYLLNGMYELPSAFNAIASNLTMTTNSYSHSFTLTIPGVSDGTIIRFTFDNVNENTVSNSEKYIEGTFRLSDCSLINVNYHGMTSSSGSTILPISVNGVFVTYAFENVVLGNPSQKINRDLIHEWYWVNSNGKWQINSEFTPNEVETKNYKHYNSAIVMLLLDCSSSLTNTLFSLKLDVKSFISKLANYDCYNPHDPPVDAVIDYWYLCLVLKYVDEKLNFF